MKKIITTFLLLCTCLSLIGCNNTNQADSDNQYDYLNKTSSDNGLNEQYQIVIDKIDEIYNAGTPSSTQTVVDEILSIMPVQMPGPINEQYPDFLGIDLSYIEEYSGVISQVNVSSDELIVIRAKDGKVDTIVELLQKRRDDKSASFEAYLQDQHTKALYGKIIVKGNDIIFAILGDVTKYDTQAPAEFLTPEEPLPPEGQQPVA